jgi:hypothetical protein
VGATIALVGMAFYAMLFPWHTVSQTAMLLAQAGLGTSAIPLCHGEATPASDPAKNSRPSKQTHCPICSGFAALQLAAAGATVVVATPPAATIVLADGTQDHLTDALRHAPQSRGPPVTT